MFNLLKSKKVKMFNFKFKKMFYWDENSLSHIQTDMSKHYLITLSIGLLIGISSILMFDNYILKKDIIYYRKHLLLDYDEIEKFRLFEIVIEKIKIEEGFKAEKYLCPSKKITIGYGHVIKEGEKFNKISEDKAEEILRSDFQYAVDVVAKKYPNLEYNKQLAVAHFIFCFGETKFYKSQLPKMINEQVDDKIIKNKIMEYNKAKVDSGEYKELSNLVKSREFEASLWDNDYERNLN